MRRLRELNQLAVRLSDELDAEAEQAVEKDEDSDELARFVTGVRLPEHPREDREQDDAFEYGFVELAGMARRPQDVAVGRRLDEADRPRNGRGSAPKLLVDEIREATEEQAERNAAGDI